MSTPNKATAKPSRFASSLPAGTGDRDPEDDDLEPELFFTPEGVRTRPGVTPPGSLPGVEYSMTDISHILNGTQGTDMVLVPRDFSHVVTQPLVWRENCGRFTGWGTCFSSLQEGLGLNNVGVPLRLLFLMC